jgi:hypothetical protein
MAETVDFVSGDAAAWRASLVVYDRRLQALDKPNLVAVDSFYRHEPTTSPHSCAAATRTPSSPSLSWCASSSVSSPAASGGRSMIHPPS